MDGFSPVDTDDGGSLAGELTTWMRVRFPFLVDMGIAASAPVLGYPGLADQYSWYRSTTDTVRRYGGDACVSAFWSTCCPICSRMC